MREGEGERERGERERERGREGERGTNPTDNSAINIWK